jgi:hypothetical protein
MIRKLVAAALAAVLLVIAVPAGADHLQGHYEGLVRATGCTAEVVTSDTHSAMESFYHPITHQVYVGTGYSVVYGLPEVPPHLAVIIVLHEAAHCLQWMYEDPVIFEGAVARELDADRRAADMACRLGMPGDKLLHDIMVWAYEKLGYEGDISHGTLEQRIRAGQGLESCRVRPHSAP